MKLPLKKKERKREGNVMTHFYVPNYADLPHLLSGMWNSTSVCVAVVRYLISYLLWMHPSSPLSLMN